MGTKQPPAPRNMRVTQAHTHVGPPPTADWGFAWDSDGSDGAAEAQQSISAATSSAIIIKKGVTLSLVSATLVHSSVASKGLIEVDVVISRDASYKAGDQNSLTVKMESDAIDSVATTLEGIRAQASSIPSQPDFNTGDLISWNITQATPTGSHTINLKAKSIKWDGGPNDTHTITVTALWQVMTETGSGSGTASLSLEIIPTDAEIPPTAPSGLAAVAGGTYVQPKVTLTWDDNSSNEDEFIIYRTKDGPAVTPRDWATIGHVGANTETFIDDGSGSPIPGPLECATKYYYQVRAKNAANAGDETSSRTADASATTLAAPAAPVAPTGLALESTDTTPMAKIKWQWAGTVPTGGQKFIIYRKPYGGTVFTALGPYVVQKVGSYFYYTDLTVGPSASYIYCVSAWNDNSVPNESDKTSTITVNTPAKPVTQSELSPFALTPGATIRVYDVAGRTKICSDRDRAIIWMNNKFFLEGLKPQLTAATLTDAGTTGVANKGLIGTFRVFIVMLRSDGWVPSIPGPASSDLTVDTIELSGAQYGHKLTITPPYSVGADGVSRVHCRDVGYDMDNNAIWGCDYWQVYLHEDGLYRPVLMATLPVTTLSYTTDANITKADLADGTRREMDVEFQNLLPPACPHRAYKNGRELAAGELAVVVPEPYPYGTNRVPTLTLSQGSQIVTATNFRFTDDLIRKEIYINNVPTGWFIADVNIGRQLDDGTLEDNYAMIMTSNQDAQAQGFQGVEGTFSGNFTFHGNPNKVYASALYAGEVAAIPSFNVEGYPPLNVFVTHFDPDDNELINSILPVRDGFVVFKRSKVFLVTGGGEIGVPVLGVTVIANGNGPISWKTVAKDHNDLPMYLCDQGLVRLSASGVEQLGVASGNSNLFSVFFDIESVAEAYACWFNTDNYYVCFGLNRIGNSGNLDGFIWDDRNGTILPFSLKRKICCSGQFPMDNGSYQILTGDDSGRLGRQLIDGVSVDDCDYTLDTPEERLLSGRGIHVRALCGAITGAKAWSPRLIRPRVKVTPDTVAQHMTFSIDGKTRSSDPTVFASDATVEYVTSQKADHVPLPPMRVTEFRVLMEFLTQAGVELEWSVLEVEAVARPRT